MLFHLLIFSTVLMFIMFIYSGFCKIFNFESKVRTLDKKLDNKLPLSLLNFGMSLVILLEILGSIIVILGVVSINHPKISKILLPLSTIVLILFLVFLVVVTLIYHPPNKAIIPFLSNVTTFGGIGVLAILINIERIII